LRVSFSLLGSAEFAAKEEVGPGSDIEFANGILEVLAMAAGSAVASTGASRHAGANSLENVIDSLDLVLDQIVSKGLVDRSQLKPLAAGSRAAARHAKSIAMLIEDKRSSPPTTPTVPLSSDGGLDKLAKVIAASNLRPLSEKDEKVSEELTASQTRLERVCETPRAAKALACLAELIESKETPVAQLEHLRPSDRTSRRSLTSSRPRTCGCRQAPVSSPPCTQGLSRSLSTRA
jgi:hypothetical protein